MWRGGGGGADGELQLGDGKKQRMVQLQTSKVSRQIKIMRLEQS